MKPAIVPEEDTRVTLLTALVRAQILGLETEDSLVTLACGVEIANHHPDMLQPQAHIALRAWLAA